MAYGGGLGEAEALGVTGGFGEGREGSDAGGAVEEGGAEVFYGVADGSDAAEASDDDTIHFESVLLLLTTRRPRPGVRSRRLLWQR